MAAIVGYNGNWNVKCECYELPNSVDISNNRSVVRVDIYVGRNANTNPSYFGGWLRGSVTVDGQTQNFSGSADESGVSAGEYRYVHVTLDYSIPHNGDGSKTVGISFNWEAYFNPKSASGNGTLDLTPIPRKTDCPSLSVIVKTPTSLTISPKAANTFQHSLQIFYGNVSYYVNANGNMQSSEYKFGTNVTRIPITIPASFYSQFSGISGQGMLRLRTYNGNTYIDQSDATLYVSVNQDLCRPYVSSYSVKDKNTKTLAITNSEDNAVQYGSRLLITFDDYYISDPEDTNTTITLKTINGTDITSLSSLYAIEEAGASFMIALKNSRNITGYTAIGISGSLYPYIPLTFNIERLKRPEPTTGEIELSYNGNFYAGDFGTSITAGKFQIGEELENENTRFDIPNNLYQSLTSTTHDTDIIVGTNYRLIERVDVTTVDDTTNAYYALMITDIEGQSTGTNFVLYSVLVTTTEGEEPVIQMQNPTTIGISGFTLGTITSINTTNSFYQYIVNTDTEGTTISNTLTLTWKYREKGASTWTTGGTLTPTINASQNTYSGYTSLGNGFDYQKQYDFQFTAEDLIHNSTGDGTITNPINPIQVEQTVTRGLPIFWWSENNIHILGDLYIDGTIHNNNS